MCDVTIKVCLCCIRAVAALEDAQDKIIFVSMYNDVEHWRKNYCNECCDIATQVASTQETSNQDFVLYWSWT